MPSTRRQALFQLEPSFAPPRAPPPTGARHVGPVPCPALTATHRLDTNCAACVAADCRVTGGGGLGGCGGGGASPRAPRRCPASCCCWAAAAAAAACCSKNWAATALARAAGSVISAGGHSAARRCRFVSRQSARRGAARCRSAVWHAQSGQGANEATRAVSRLRKTTNCPNSRTPATRASAPPLHHCTTHPPPRASARPRQSRGAPAAPAACPASPQRGRRRRR